MVFYVKSMFLIIWCKVLALIWRVGLFWWEGIAVCLQIAQRRYVLLRAFGT